MRISYLATSENGIESYKIENANGAYAVIITYGARIANLCVKDKTATSSTLWQALKIPTDL